MSGKNSLYMTDQLLFSIFTATKKSAEWGGLQSIPNCLHQGSQTMNDKKTCSSSMETDSNLDKQAGVAIEK